MEKAFYLPINKTRLKLIGFGYIAITLVILAVFFMIATTMTAGWKTAFQVVGVLIAVALLLVASGAVKLLQNKEAGLHITPNGIVDISSAIGVGQIEWKNITSLEVRPREKLVLILLKKPELVLKSASNKAIRQLLEKNQVIYKTPVVLESKYLQCTFDDMVALLEQGLNKFGTKKK